MSFFDKITDLQKLEEAWRHVRKNRPASGVDEITWAQFDQNQKQEIYQLQLELKSGRYEPQPVKEVTHYKGEKERKIALFCMRDKVVHQSIACELEKIYEPLFSSNSFAYRPNQSALKAAERIEAAVTTNEWALKLDIHHFFDAIEHKKLLNQIRGQIKEEDVLELLQKIFGTKSLDQQSGRLLPKERGIYQGSSLSPICSNIYMMKFDADMSEQNAFFVRYSDDMIFLGESEDAIRLLRKNVENYLAGMGLQLSKEKTSISPIKDGIDFLGFYFDKNGKKNGIKAEESLRERLEVMWLTNVNLSPEEKLKKGSEILIGWNQYFRDNRNPTDILEYAVLLYILQKRKETVDEKYISLRFYYDNPYADLLEWLVNYWKELGKVDYIRREYEQYFHKSEYDQGVMIDIGNPQHAELLEHYHRLLIFPEKEEYESLMQIYSDLRCYNMAASWQKDLQQYLDNQGTRRETVPKVNSGSEAEWNANAEERQLFMLLFCGREDLYAVEKTENGRRVVQMVCEPLTEDVIKRHLNGEITAHTYVSRGNSTASFLVLDVDISKKILLQHPYGTSDFDSYLKKALNAAVSLKRKLEAAGLTSYLEFSGCRGYHLWIFFREWIPIRYINILQDYIETKLKPEIWKDDELQLEFFPNKGKIRPGKPGQCVKLPYGVHSKSAQISYFLDRDGNAISDIGKFLKEVVSYPLKTVKKMASRLMIQEKGSLLEISNGKEEKLDTKVEAFGKLDAKVREVLLHCNLMLYLCQKARKTGYLGHFERLSVLYVFGHLGDSGKQFVHTVMEFTLNYQYQITEKFIHRLPEKPVSCIKLRDQYKTVTAGYGCNCNFQRMSNCYPSPVLHAIKYADEDISDVTMPFSRSLSKAGEKKAAEELNVHKRVQDLSSRILELKKQKRAIDKNIRRMERELENEFDRQKVDCMEIEMGLLVRRKTEKGYEWLVEI